MEIFRRLFGKGKESHSEATNKEVRQQVAAEVLESTDAPAVDAAEIEQHIVALGNEDMTVRFTAIAALTKIGAPAVKPLIAALRGKHEEFLVAAGLTLSKIGSAAVEPLITALGDEDRNVRMAVALVLGEIGDKNVIAPLVAAHEDEDSEVRKAVTEALDKLGWKPDQQEEAKAPGTPAVGELSSRVADEGRKQEIAAEGPQSTDIPDIEQYLVLLDEHDWDIWGPASEALTKMGGSVVEPLLVNLEELIDSDRLKDIRRADHIISTLGDIGDKRALGPLIECLKHRMMQSAAVSALGQLGDTRAVEPLLPLLADSRVRLPVIKALGQLGDARAVGPLIAVLKEPDRYNAPTTSLRENAAKVLGQLGDRRAVLPLIAALEVEKGLVRESIVKALGQIGDGRAAEPLKAAAALDKYPYEIRDAVSEALEQLGPPGDELPPEEEERQYSIAEVTKDSGPPTVETIIAVLKDRGKRQASIEALVKIGEPAVMPLIAALHELNVETHWVDLKYFNVANAVEAAIEALSEIGDVRAVDPILSVVRDKEGLFDSVERQEKLAGTLAKFGATAVELLVAVIQDPDDDFRARWAAAKSLAKIGDERTVEPFIVALKDKNKEVREGAAEGLARIGDPRAVEPLIAALRDSPGHKNARVRIYAAEGLAKIGDARGIEPLTAALSTDDNEFVRRAVEKALDHLNVPGRKPAPGVRRVEQMTMVHYALMGYSNAKLTEFADQAAVGGSIKLKIPIGDVAELADGIGILVDRIESFREVEIGIDLLDWAVAVTDAMDKGTAVTRRANHQAALECWQKAYEMAPGYPLVLMSLGVSYAYCGDASSAIKYLEEAHRLAPKNQRIKGNLEGIKRDLL